MEYKQREYTKKKKKQTTDPFSYEMAYDLGLEYAIDVKEHQKQMDEETKLEEKK